MIVGLDVKPLRGGECVEREAQVADQDEHYDEGPQGPPSVRADRSPAVAGSIPTGLAAVHGRTISKSRLHREPSPARASQGSTRAGDSRAATFSSAKTRDNGGSRGCC